MNERGGWTCHNSGIRRPHSRSVTGSGACGTRRRALAVAAVSVALQVFKSCAPEECEAEYEAIGSGTYAVSLIGFGYFGTQAWLAVDVEESAAELQGVAAPYGDGARMAGTILYRVESIERAVDVRDSEHGSSFPPGFQAPPGPTWDTSGEETQ